MTPPRLPPELDSPDLGRQFRAHLNRVKEVLGDPRLTASQSPILQEGVAEIRTLAKLIGRELGTADFLKDVVDSASLRRTADFLERSELLVESVREQLQWATQVTRQAEELRPFVETVLRHHARQSEPMNYDTLTQFVAPLLSRNPLSAWPTESHPLAQISIDSLTERWSDPLAARVHVQGILSAWSAVHHAKRLWLNDQNILPLAIAALLQDIGILALDRARQDSSAWHEEQDSLPRDHHRHHPAIGAAIVAEITDMPPQVPNLIAQHHQRLDGSAELNRHARLLQIIVRQEELRLAHDNAAQLTTNSDRTTVPQQLSAEAHAGNFDLEFVRLFVSARDSEIPSGDALANLSEETGRQYTVDPPHLGEDRHKGPSASSANLERIKEQPDR